MEGGWEVETHEGERQTEMIKVLKAALKWCFSWKYYSFGVCWDSPDCRVQI